MGARGEGGGGDLLYTKIVKLSVSSEAKVCMQGWTCARQKIAGRRSRRSTFKGDRRSRRSTFKGDRRSKEIDVQGDRRSKEIDVQRRSTFKEIDVQRRSKFKGDRRSRRSTKLSACNTLRHEPHFSNVSFGFLTEQC